MAISGDGSTVVYLGNDNWTSTRARTPRNCPDDPLDNQVGVVDWDGSDKTWLTCIETGATTYGSAFAAHVTDDGQTIFYTGEGIDGASLEPGGFWLVQSVY